MMSRAAVLTFAFILAAGAACHQKPAPAASPVKDIMKASESDLLLAVVCQDSLGRYAIDRDKMEFTTCTPCITYAVQASPDQAVRHARRLWQQGARAPYDTLDIGAVCTRLSYRYARALRPNDDSLAIEMSLVDLAASMDSARTRALHIVDSLVQQRVNEGRRTQAAVMMTQLAMGIWDRAQRELERPADIGVSKVERLAHQLAFGAPLMTQLPVIPETSKDLGVSEAKWSARLFDAAARLATTPADRSRLMRLALAPWVVLEDWAALDSAARALLQRAPNDSALLPARALAAYKTMSHPVLSAPSVMALFDTALAHLPRVDSLRFDGFDGVLTAQDDQWRYGFLPDQRIALDWRGWSVLDPLWSTPVNGILLARRARVAEADYRYADIARPSESGSETLVGQMLLRRGAPSPQWIISKRCGAECTTENYPTGKLWILRSWRGLTATIELQDWPSNWRMFYGTRLSPTRVSQFELERPCTTGESISSLYRCAISDNADWNDVPFYRRTDDIDVTIARFRARGDSADVYIGARLPLRGFRSRDDGAASRADRIEVAAWMKTEFGRPVFHQSVSRALPAANMLAWTQQWTYRARAQRSMHRVEAMEPRQPAGARGSVHFTTDSQVTFPLRGFGMSDVLVAASAAPRQGEARRWSDLVIQPNGASVAPAERFAMIWEIYDLVPGPDKRVHWRVRIKRERGSMVVRDNMQRVLSGSDSAGTRVIAGESGAPDMSYVQSAVATGVVLENIMFGLGDAGPGRHVVNVTIDDLVSGKSVTRGVSVRGVIPELLKRGTKIGTPR